MECEVGISKETFTECVLRAYSYLSHRFKYYAVMKMVACVIQPIVKTGNIIMFL